MPNERKAPSILVVDDDPHVLATMVRMLQNRFEITAESDPWRALAIVRSGREFATIVSDLQMPGVTGLVLLQEARRHAPNMQRVLVSGAADLSDAVSAINDCQVFRVLIKPFQTASLLDAVSTACEQHRLVIAERQLLEETLRGSVQALAELFLLVQPAAFGRAMRLRRHVADLARHLGVERSWDIEIAALFSQIGTMTLSAEMLDRWYRGRELTPEESAEIGRLSATAQSLIANIPRLESVNEILRAQNLPPSAGNVPPGARMLAIAYDFDILIAQGATADHALATLESREGRYDREYLAAFRALRGGTAPARQVHEIRLMDVADGMVLASDVYGPTGLLLIARGQRVTPGLLHRIRTRWAELAAVTQVRAIVP